MKNFIKTIINSLQSWTKNEIKKSASDWNENNPNADSYVKNRTHWKEYTDVVYISEQSFVTRNPCGMGAANWYYTFTDSTPVKDVKIGEKYIVVVDGIEYEDVARDVEGGICFGKELPYLFDGPDKPYGIFIHINNNTVAYSAIGDKAHTFKVYRYEDVVHQIDSEYLPSCMDWAENNPDLSGFIKNRTHYLREGIELCNFTINGDYEFVDNINLVTDTPYIVFYDGVRYAVTSRNQDGGVAIGDYWFNEYPFFYGYQQDGEYVRFDKKGKHTFQVYTADVKKLDNFYLPDFMSQQDPVGTGSFSMNRKAGTTVGLRSHAEGSNTTASGNSSHAEGSGTTASGNYAHAEGAGTTASAQHSHAEGYSTEASGYASHAEGDLTKASGYASHAEGRSTIASGYYSHTEGLTTRATHAAQHVEGKFNILDTSTNKSHQFGTYAHIVGNGTSDTARSNAHTLDWNGVGWFQGGLQVGGNAQDDGAKNVLLEGDAIPVPETASVGQLLAVKTVDESGKPSEWECTDQSVKNVKSYGATGDGTTDDTDAIADAIANCVPGDTLYFPSGVYRVSNVNLKSDMTVRGDGWCSVIKLLDATSDYHGRNNCLNIENVSNIIVRDIKLDGTRETQQSTAASQDGRLDGIHIRYASDIMVENVWMYNNGYHGCIMTYASNVVFERCKSTDNGFRPIHGHTQIYNCRVSNCLCENNGLGLTGGSGFENDSIFFFGMQHLTISDNIIKSNRRGCITVGSDQDSTGAADIVPSRNVTISGNVCECYEDLAYVPTAESDTGVAKFQSMGIVVHGGKHVLENVSVTGNTIKNAHEAIKLYSQENELCSINAVVSGNTIIDCSYGIYAVEVADITISSNQFLNLAHSLLYAESVERLVFKGNNVNAPGISENNMCRLYKCDGVVIQGNHLVGDCERAFYVPASNTDVIVKDNVLSGFSYGEAVLNTNGSISGNLYITYDETELKVAADPYANAGFVRPTLANPNTTSTWWNYTTPVEITEDDTLYELNTYIAIPVEYTDPTAYDASSKNTAIVFLTGTDLTTAVGIANLSNGNGSVAFSETCISGTSNNIWGVKISLTAERVKELFPAATHVMMQVETSYTDPDNLASAYHNLNDGHAYVYRIQTGDSQITGDDVELDVTLTVEGKAADARAVGEAISTKIPAPPTAQVGQLLAVKAVDENGKPTEWEAADRSTGVQTVYSLTTSSDTTTITETLSLEASKKIQSANLVTFYIKVPRDSADTTTETAGTITAKLGNFVLANSLTCIPKPTTTYIQYVECTTTTLLLAKMGLAVPQITHVCQQNQNPGVPTLTQTTSIWAIQSEPTSGYVLTITGSQNMIAGTTIEIRVM